MPILVALGGADCVWDDLKQARKLLKGFAYDVGAVNDAGCVYKGKLTLWATLHPEKLGGWVQRRQAAGFNMDFTLVVHRTHRDLKEIQQRILEIKELWAGSSGLYLPQVAAITFGYDRIVCCGIPMTGTPHFFSDQPWGECAIFTRGWKRAKDQPELRGKVRSMSGYTRELVGSPTREWLEGGARAD